MRSKSRNTLFRILASLLALFFLGKAYAYPDQERAALSLISSQATAMALESNKYLYTTFGTGISRIDLSTWALAADQIPALTDLSSSGGTNLTGTIAGLAIRNRTLFATQSDGDLIIVDLDHVTNRPTTVDLGSSSLGALVADPETGADDDKLYILDKTTNAVLIYDIGARVVTASFALLDELGTSIAPLSIVFDAEENAADKIFVTSSASLVFLVNEGVASVGGRVRVSSTTTELSSAAVDSDHDFLFVVNTPNSKVHVIDIPSFLEVDTDVADTGNKGIPLSANGNLKSVSVVDVSDPTDTYAYVTGTSGMSVINLNISSGTFNAPTVLDFTDTGGSDVVDNPLSLSSAPGLLISTSDGNLITSNGNASFSIVSDNPFVTIASSSLGSGSLSTTGSYTLTFQSDETGTYAVKVGGSLTSAGAGTGTEVTTGSVGTADANLTTASINYSSSLYTEGTNRIYVFVTDSDGNIGHDAIDITVDTPPPAVTINSTGFGNGFVTVNFDRLSTSDIDYYNLYVSTDPDAVNTMTTASATVDHPSSGTTVTGRISGLTNLTTYYVAVAAVDNGATVGSRTNTYGSGTTRVTASPEVTRGLSGSVGEAGCALISEGLKNPESTGTSIPIFGILISLFFFRRFPKKSFLSLLIIVAFPILSYAESKNPRHWTFELQGGAWQPTDPSTKTYLGACCDPLGKISLGYLWKDKFGFEIGLGYIGSGGTAVGATSGLSSNTRFNFSMMPMESSVAFRGRFKDHQLFVPYVKVGPDYVFFRENNQGSVVKGWKSGFHGTIGMGFDLSRIDELSQSSRDDMGVNDVYFVVEGRYGWINGFGGTGVDLSGFTWTGGLLFEF